MASYRWFFRILSRPQRILLAAAACITAAFFASIGPASVAAAESSDVVAHARELRAVAVRISDGDTATFEVPRGQNAGTKLRVRFAGIDAPETAHRKGDTGQPFGDEALVSLKQLIGSSEVTIVVCDRDRYGRIVALVYSGGELVNLEMVRRGMAHVYHEYLRKLPRDVAQSLVRAEKEAREARRGLWKQASPESPADFRRRTKRSGN